MKEYEIKILFKGRNMITPNVIEYGECGEHVYELSDGTNPMDATSRMYGVTVLTKDGKRTSMSRAYHSREDAYDYIKGLQHG